MDNTSVAHDAHIKTTLAVQEQALAAFQAVAKEDYHLLVSGGEVILNSIVRQSGRVVNTSMVSLAFSVDYNSVDAPTRQALEDYKTLLQAFIDNPAIKYFPLEGDLVYGVNLQLMRVLNSPRISVLSLYRTLILWAGAYQYAEDLRVGWIRELKNYLNSPNYQPY